MDFKEDFRENYPLLVLSPRFKVELYEVSRDLRTRAPKGFIDDIIGRSDFIQNPLSSTVTISVDIPVTKSFINSINEIKRLGRLPALDILVECDCIYYERGSNPIIRASSAHVRKPIYSQEESLVIFTTDEVDLLMKDLKYIEILRVELSLPLKIEHTAQEKLAKSVNEIMVAKDLLVKGEHDKVLHTCRNVIMNYLTKVIEVEKKIKRERRECSETK